ncbi:hypothetical protein I316_00595 [Kwoniella heveanensis BCC8398]|uniref:Uncharacterized protein n=1 Tax=Kwoniella heveanensis BCC8398 TaxID=1296120 RepID=A0A1B9H2H6_9TREE|nr:hypothetical protein I316_00595 [Kwoniella heveanensis BCC8398]
MAVKGCTDSPSFLNPGDIRAHTKSSHPQLSPTSLETAEAFSLSPYARQTPPQPPPLDAPALRVQSLSTVPAYLVSSPIIHPFPKGTPLPIDISRANSPPFSRYHNYSHFRRQPPRLAQIGLPIVPDRTDEDVPFHPTCGEASPGYFVGFSCSIFPPNKAEDGLPVMQSLTDRKGRPIVPTSSRAGQHPFTIRKKATGKDGDIIPGRPRLIVPADVYAERQKTIDAEKKMRLKRRLRRKMLRNDWETKDEALKATLKKLSHEQTRRAGMRLAAKKVGSSVGYAFWKEVVRFEAEVIGAGMDVEVGEGEGDGDVKVEADIEMEGDDDVAPNSRDGMSSRSPAHDGAEESLNDFDRGESESKLDLTPDFGAVPEGNASNAKDNDNNANIDVYETKNGEDYIDGDSIADGKKDGDGEANAIEVD